MKKSRHTKITVLLPSDLLSQAEDATGLGTTATVCEGLKLIAVYDKLRHLRGKVKIELDLESLGADADLQLHR